MDNDFLIGGASASLIIMLFIQIIKSYGLPSHLAPLVAIVLGVSFSVLSEYATPAVPTEPISEASRWVAAAVRGFMVAVAAVGIYAVTKNSQDKTDERRAQDVAEKGDAVLVEVVSPTPDAEEGGAVGELISDGISISPPPTPAPLRNATSTPLPGSTPVGWGTPKKPEPEEGP